GGLFTPPRPDQCATTGGQAAAPKRAPGVRRTRDADLDAVYLRRLLGAERLALADGRVTGKPEQFQLNLFDDAAPRLVKLDSSVNELGHTIVRATVVGGG